MKTSCLVLILVFGFLTHTTGDVRSESQGTFLRDVQNIPCSCDQNVADLVNNAGAIADASENNGVLDNAASDASIQGDTGLSGNSDESSNNENNAFLTQDTQLGDSSLSKRDTSQCDDLLDCQCGVQCSCPQTCSCRQRKSILTPTRGQLPPYLINRMAMRHESPYLGLPAKGNAPQVISQESKIDFSNYAASPPRGNPLYPTNKWEKAPTPGFSPDAFVQRNTNGNSNFPFPVDYNANSNGVLLNSQLKSNSNVEKGTNPRGNPEISVGQQFNSNSNVDASIQNRVNPRDNQEASVEHQLNGHSNSLVENNVAIDANPNASEDNDNFGVRDNLASMTNDNNRDLLADADMGVRYDNIAGILAHNNVEESCDSVAESAAGVSLDNIASLSTDNAELSDDQNERVSDNTANIAPIVGDAAFMEDTHADAVENGKMDSENALKSDSSADNRENSDSLKAIDARKVEVDSANIDGVDENADSGIMEFPTGVHALGKANAAHTAFSKKSASTNSIDSGIRMKADVGNKVQTEKVDSAGPSDTSDDGSGAFIRDVQNVPCAKRAYNDQDDTEWVRNAASVPYSKEDDMLLRNSASPMANDDVHLGSSAEIRSVKEDDRGKPAHYPSANDNKLFGNPVPCLANEEQLIDANGLMSEAGNKQTGEHGDRAEFGRTSLQKRDTESNDLLDCACGFQCSCPQTCSCRQRKSVVTPTRGQLPPYLMNRLAMSQEFPRVPARDNQPQGLQGCCDKSKCASCPCDPKCNDCPKPTPPCRPNCSTRPPPCCDSNIVANSNPNAMVAPGRQGVADAAATGNNVKDLSDNQMLVSPNNIVQVSEQNSNINGDSLADQSEKLISQDMVRLSDDKEISVSSDNTAQFTADQHVSESDDHTVCKSEQSIGVSSGSQAALSETDKISENLAKFSSEDTNDLSMKDTLDPLSVKKEMPPTCNDEVLNVPENNGGNIENAEVETNSNAGNVDSTNMQDSGGKNPENSVDSTNAEVENGLNAKNNDPSNTNSVETANVESSNELDTPKGDYVNKLDSGDMDSASKLSIRNSNSVNPSDLTKGGSLNPEDSQKIEPVKSHNTGDKSAVNFIQASKHIESGISPNLTNSIQSGSNNNNFTSSMPSKLVVRTVDKADANPTSIGAKNPVTFRKVNPKEYELGQMNGQSSNDYNEEIRSKRDLLDTMETIQPLEDTREADSYSR